MEDEATGAESAVEIETPDTPEVEATEVEADDVELDASEEATETDADDDAEVSEDGEDDSEDQDPEIVEFDFGGNKMQLPKGSVPDELAEQIDKFTKGTWSDYTKKSQEIAESRKSLEAREGAVQKLESMNGEVLDSYATGRQLKAEIEQLQGVNLQALWQSDPDQARRVSDTLSAKQAQFQTTVNDVAQKEQELTQAQSAEMERRKDEGKQLIERQSPGFETLRKDDVVTYAVEKLGVDPDAAKDEWALNPAMTLAVEKAMMFDRMQAKAKKPATKPTQAKPVKPVAKKGGTRTTSAPSDNDSVEVWAAKRQKQIARRQAL